MTHIRYPDVRRNLWHVRFPSCAPLLYVYLHASLYKSYCGWFHILLRTNTTHTLQWSTVAQKSSALYFFFWDSLSGCKDEWMRRWSVASGGGNLPLTPFFFCFGLLQTLFRPSAAAAAAGHHVEEIPPTGRRDQVAWWLCLHRRSFVLESFVCFTLMTQKKWPEAQASLDSMTSKVHRGPILPACSL